MSMEIERPNLAVAKPVTINLALFSRLSRNREEMLHYLQEWTLIPRVGDYKCPKPKCKAALKLMYLSASKDGWVWYCSKRASINNQKVKQCRHQIAIRTGTFFARSKLELWQIMGFVNLWVDNASLDIITGQVRMNSRAAIAWGTACKQVIFTNYLRNRVKLGGEGITVEIYESSHDSRQTEKKWVFGVYERNTGNLFMVSVKFKDANTLVPIIKERIQVGTTIVSDFWRNYDCLNTEDYTDLKVNQNICFKNPDASLTSSWWHLTKISFSGRISAPKPGNLAKYLFLKRCRKMNLDKTREFFRLTGNIHNPARTGEDADISEDDVLDSEDEWTY